MCPAHPTPVLELSSAAGPVLVLHQPSVECVPAKGGGASGSSCQGKAECPQCAEGANKVFGAYNVRYGDRYDDNSCRDLCLSR